MPDSVVDEIKSKVNIIEIIGEHVKLTKSGSNFRGLCPFHQEKTPSFMVSEELQIYKCFGCGEGGDVFTFLEKYEGMDFSEVLRFLAEKSGVALTQNNSFAKGEKDVLYEINAIAAKFYNFLLISHPVGKTALNYIKEERKVEKDSIKTFNIGYAPAGKNALSDFLIKKKKFKLKDLEKAGVIFVTKYGKVYDRFEGRIIFPISDHRGNVIALAGRILPPGRKEAGKYINSPQTQIYNKSASLYGIFITKDYIKKDQKAVVVEGELDLISSFQIGIKNIVAIKGSAFTPDQARLLGRYVKEVILALDSDFAGIKAAIKGIKILEDQDFDVKVATLGKYKDPDEAAKINPDFLKERLEKAVPVWDFIIDSIVAKYDKNSASGKAKISNELAPLLSQIKNKVVEEHYIHKLANLLEVTDVAVAEEVEKKKDYENEIRETPVQKTTKSLRELREEKLVSLIIKSSPKLLKDKNISSLITTPILKRLSAEFDIKDKSAKFLPKELFDKFGELSLNVSEDTEKGMKDEINNLYRLLNMQDSLEKYKNSDNEKDSLFYQKMYKDFESGNFERII